jgi:signal transduction histidine kinase/ligand-binding sensor domain-containing protein
MFSLRLSISKTISALLFCLIHFVTFSQNPFARYKVEKIDAHQGLTSDYIFNTFQASDGYLWLSSYAGFIRYDGKTFETFNSKNTPQIKADNNNGLFTESADGTMWFPTPSSGLLSFKDGIFKSYLEKSAGLLYLGKTAKKELVILDRSAIIDSLLIIFNTTTHQYKRVPGKNRFQYLAFRNNEKDTSLIRWRVRNGIIQYDDPAKGEINFGTNAGITTDMSFSGFFKDSRKRIWITTEFGLFTSDGHSIQPYPGMNWSRIIQNNASFGHIAEDKEGGIWLSTGNGLSYLPPNETRFHEFPKDILNIQTLHNINIDREENIWLATDRGLFKISHTNLINYAEAEGISNNRVSAICEKGNHQFLIASADSKLYELKNNRVSSYPLKNKTLLSNTRNILYLFTSKDGNIWLCTDGNIFKLSAESEIKIPVDGQVRYACEGIDGRIYFGVAFKGIGFINEKGKFEYLPFPGFDFSPVYTSKMFQRKDGTWVMSTYNTGIYYFQPDGKVIRKELFDSTKGIQAFDMYREDAQTFWVASGKGLVRIRGNQKQYIGAEAGLEELSLFKILPDNEGYWWIPSNIGIFRVKKAELDAYLENPQSAKINWRIFDEGDGMYNRQCVGARHSIVSSDGNIMVLGIGGLVEIDPKMIKKNNIPPLISIRKVTVDYTVYPLGENNTIAPGNHRYIFDYSDLSYTAPEKNKIKFRLVGYDKNWINSKGDQKAFYTGLGPGQYRFEVLGTNNDGVWASQPASFVFEVKPMYYQTIWFRSLMVLIFIAAVWGFIQWKTRTTRLTNLKLEQQVAERTAELQASLENLTATQKQLIQSEKMASLGELTAGIAHEIQNPLNFVNNFSEVNLELIEEVKSQKSKLKNEELDELLSDIAANEEKINHHGKRADAIVKGMLLHSRSSSGQKEPTDINALCDEYLRLSYHGLRAKDKSFNATFKTNFDHSIGKIKIVSQDMGRVMLNIINNAFYAVDEKLNTERLKSDTAHYQPTVTVSTKKLNGRVEISIEDNGNGIPDAVREKIFQPFFTTKPTGQGTGLGLSLSYDIVKAHGGELKVETTEGKGTSFIIQLPI